MSEYITNEVTCINCYNGDQSSVNCIDENFSSSSCCAYSDPILQSQCTSKYKFCTTNLQHGVYKVFTCPPFSCPNGFEKVSHTSLNSKNIREISWGSFSDGFNCKAQILADSSLNGKLRVNVNVRGAYIYLY